MPPQQKQHTVEFSDAEITAIKDFAERNHMTTEQAVTWLASDAIQARFKRSLAPKANVIPFKAAA